MQYTLTHTVDYVLLFDENAVCNNNIFVELWLNTKHYNYFYDILILLHYVFNNVEK